MQPHSTRATMCKLLHLQHSGCDLTDLIMEKLIGSCNCMQDEVSTDPPEAAAGLPEGMHIPAQR
jgi:hypothetical protein